MKFQFQKRRKNRVLPMLLMVGILGLAGYYGIGKARNLFRQSGSQKGEELEETNTADPWEMVSGKSDSLERDALETIASETDSGENQVVYAGSRRVTAELPMQTEGLPIQKEEILEYTVLEEEPDYSLFLIAEEGYITAYLGDQTEIYEYTQIPVTSFPPAQQKMLEEGLYMDTFEDYYDFLESYTS
jgi:hypothetical protein